MQTLSYFLVKEGIGDKKSKRKWFADNDVLLNGKVVDQHAELSAGDTLMIRGKDYRITETDEPGRLGYQTHSDESRQKIKGRTRVHCGYHKCLTMYFRRISEKTVRFQNPVNGATRHFFHRLDEFHRDCSDYTLSSISGHCLDLNRFEDVRVVHIIRDPRDLLISGYYYHKRATEEWCTYLNPTGEDWAVVNGAVPSTLPPNTSFSDYLHEVSLEEGLLAEMEFRSKHFETMNNWPVNDPRVLTVKYEDILGNEKDTLKRIYKFYGFAPQTRWAAGFYADRYSFDSQRRHETHIRNPKFGQWKELFTPGLEQEFQNRFGALLEKYGY